MVDNAKIGERTRKRAGKNHDSLSGPERNLNSAIIKEMELQCDLALKGFDELEKALSECDDEKVWYSIHSFFSSAARISELLKLGEKAIEKNRENDDLRKLMKISNSSLLSNPKWGRAIGDFGEKLEEWATKTDRTHIGEKNVIPKGCVSEMDEEDMLRHFDPETYEFTLRGETYDLKKCQEKISEVKDVIEDLARKSFWDI
ncbi:MAG: hypothetical protein V5A88_09840 [Candidatus Thermoplasmatota archaeon]